MSKSTEQIYLWLKSQPCFDCGKAFPTECMDFDHRPDEIKIHSPQKFLANIEKFLAEIAKCDLVCACCHRTRTKNRGLSEEAKRNQKAALARPEVREKMRAARERSLQDPIAKARLVAAQNDPEVNARRAASLRKTMTGKKRGPYKLRSV